MSRPSLPLRGEKARPLVSSGGCTRSAPRAGCAATILPRVTLFGVVLIMSTVALAAPASEVPNIPDLLRPWVEWVLHGQTDARCPWMYGLPDRRQCTWPSRLVLEVGDRTGAFAQEWHVDRDGWVPVPGDAKVWPQLVEVDGQPAVVTEGGGVPRVRLERGSHAVGGAFEWQALPESLQVPPETGLLQLTVRGQPVRFPDRDEQGRLWLQARPAQMEETESRLDVIVTRRVVDDIPVQLTTRVELRVAGAAREVVLGKAMPDGFVPMSLTAPLPARLEADGHLRVQVRPGTWVIELTARHDAPVSVLELPAAAHSDEGIWAASEVWVFEARNDLRVVSVQGVPAVDPQQTVLPDEWKRLPAYLLHPGDHMALVEKQRGDADPAADQLRLQRAWWLDFDGRGYTLHDDISGTMNRGWRLEMSPPTQLGRVAVGGEDQFLTRRGDSADVGVEIGHGTVQVDADSRLTGDIAHVPAVSWNQDFREVSGQLHLPPGWRLLHASGVDGVSTTWLSSWTLLDLFVVLLIAMIVARLWGAAAGALATATLVLTYMETGAPRSVWLAMLATTALVRVLPEGRLLRVAKLTRIAAAVAVAVIAVPFMVLQVRQALYPALEYPWLAAGQGSAASTAADTSERVMRKYKRADQPAPTEYGAAQGGRPLYQHEVDPNALVQTGPGLPRWQWNTVDLRWQGPVERGQRMHLLLIPPAINFALAFVRVVLLAVLVLLVIQSPSPSAWWRRRGGGRAVALSTVLLSVLVAAGLSARARADWPSTELLDQLRSRLLEKPDCYPTCASIPDLRLDVDASGIRGSMGVDVAADTALPLPGSAPHWSPSVVKVDDGGPLALVRGADGFLWLRLSAGTHRIVFSGGLPDRDSVQIPLPLKPHRVEARTDGWVLDGLHEDGLADDSLQLTRRRGTDEGAAKEALHAATLPPFVRVERELRLGLAWTVQTTVRRLTPLGAAVVVEVPLLPGESVTSAGLRVVDDKALVNMAAQESQVQWQSMLAERDSMTLRAAALRAPDPMPWAEVWRLDASPVWHVETQGIPVVYQSERGGRRSREWRPWPAEAVTIDISRPAGVAGPTLTIDGSVMAVSPGLRSTDVTLGLDVRSSRGGQHTLRLPAAVELESVAINGVSQPIRQEQQTVTLPLVPGRQSAQLTWRQHDAMQQRFTSPPVDLGVPSVNAEVRITMPADRWTLLVGGPRLGPAVLFWGVLAVLLLVSIGLGFMHAPGRPRRLTPLRWYHWFLLGIGLTQVPIRVGVIVAGWLLALGFRRERGRSLGDLGFNTAQLLLVVWTAAALAGLFWSVRQGLLGLPEMQIAGNGSSASLLRWYSDTAAGTVPRAWVISVPVVVYRLAMLAWALWLAQALVRWLRWGWECFADGGLSRPWRRKLRAPAAAPASVR